MKNKLPNIQDRLIGGLVLLLTLSMLISILYIKDIEKLNNKVNNIVKHPYAVSNSARDIKMYINAMHRSMKDVVLAINEDQFNEAVELVNVYEKKVFEKFNLIFELYLGYPETVEDAYQYFINWKPIRDKVIEHTLNNNIEAAADITKGKGADYVEKLLSKTNNLIAFADEKANQFNKDAYEIQKKVKRKAIAFILIAFLLGVITFIWIINSFNKPLDSIINRIKSIPNDLLINKLPENERNKLALLHFAFKELDDHKKMMQIKINERTKELKESQEIIHLAINNAPIGIAEINIDNTFRKANQEFCNLIGYSEKELLNLTFNDITLEEDRSIGLSMINKIVEGVISQGRIEKRYIHKSGKIIHCALTTSLVSDLNNKPLYFFSHIVDITKQKKFQDELIKHQEKLETIVKDRTKQLDEKAKRLSDSQKALVYLVEDVNESRDEMKLLNTQIKATNKELEAFSYSVSHDLRAPLRGINGFTKILLEDYAPLLDDEGKRVCNIIEENSKKMGMLIDDLLAFSRLNRIDLSQSVLSTKKMIEAMFYEITDAESRKSIKLNIGNIDDAMADSTLLKQVWTNLLSNAIKYSSKKETSEIHISSKTDNGKFVYCIKDNGVGFDIKYVDKLFGVFQRLHNIKDFEGTGVGLAIVQRIVLRHGGEVWAEGEVDKGAAFYFSLPIIQDDSN